MAWIHHFAARAHEFMAFARRFTARAHQFASAACEHQSRHEVIFGGSFFPRETRFLYRWSLRGGGVGTERSASPGDIVASRVGEKLCRKHIIAVASTTQSPPPHLGKECITHGLACIHSVIYLMPYIFFLCVHDEILPLFQYHLNFFVAKVFFIFSFSKRLMLEHAFLFFSERACLH